MSKNDSKAKVFFFFGLWLAGVFCKALKPPLKISRSATVALHAPELLNSKGAGQTMHKFMWLRAAWLANLKTR